MTLTKKEIRSLASRLANVDEALQRAIATLNQDMSTVGFTVGASLVWRKIPSTPPGTEAKDLLLSAESEIADIKQIMQAAGAKEAK